MEREIDVTRRLLSNKMERRQVHLEWKVPGEREIEWKSEERKKGSSIAMHRQIDISGCFCHRVFSRITLSVNSRL